MATRYAGKYRRRPYPQATRIRDGTASDGRSISKVGEPKTNGQIFSPTTRAGSGVAKNCKRGKGHNYRVFFQTHFFWHN